MLNTTELTARCDGCGKTVHAYPASLTLAKKLGWEVDLESGYVCCPDCVGTEKEPTALQAYGY
jgi:hypothetical protein